MAALRAAGLAPHSFLPEYGARQYEVTIHPTHGLRAADEAVIQREMAPGRRASPGCARDLLADPRSRRGRQRHAYPFQPARREPGAPLSHDPERPYGLSRVGGAVRRRGASSSAGAGRDHGALGGVVLPAAAEPLGADLGQCRGAGPRRQHPRLPDLWTRRRGAAIQHRIPRRRCRREPLSGARRGDLGRGRRHPQRALVAARAGAQFLGDEPTPNARPPAHAQLPRSLEEALGHLEASEAARDWFGETFFRAYLHVQAGRIARHRGADRGRDLRPLCGGVLTHPQISI